MKHVKIQLQNSRQTANTMLYYFLHFQWASHTGKEYFYQEDFMFLHF